MRKKAANLNYINKNLLCEKYRFRVSFQVWKRNMFFLKIKLQIE